jgi:glycosyltransferase involved in cell wall biosynthesis
LGGSAKQFADLFIYLAYFCFVKQRLLLFDTILDGHHPEYLIHLIGYYSSRPEVDVIVATGASFQATFAKRQAAEQLVWGGNIQFYPIQEQLIVKGNIFLRSLREWNLMLSIAKETDASQAMLMYMDYFPLGAILGKKAEIPVAGISFRPPHQIQGAFDFIKHKIWQSMLASGQISTVFSLVHAAVPLINTLANGNRALALADPVIQLPVSATQIADFRLRHGIPSDKKVYLNFGQLDQRKGIEAFLTACKQLSGSDLRAMCLLLAGPIESNYAAKIDQLLEKLPDLHVVKLYDYLHYPTVELCFEVADVVLVTYQGHLGMSSVLIRAALVGKPVIGTCHGTIGATIEAYELGKSLEPFNAVDFAQALQGALHTNAIKQAELVRQNSVEAFTLTIAQGIESLY